LGTGATLLRTRPGDGSVFTTGTGTVLPSVFTTGTGAVLPSVFTTGTGAVLPSVFTTGTGTALPSVITTGTCTEWHSAVVPTGALPANLTKADDRASMGNPRGLSQRCLRLQNLKKLSKTTTPRPWMSLAMPACTGIEPAVRVHQYRTLRVERRATVKDIDLPGSLHRTTNARRYEVAAGVAKTATGIRWMLTASPAAPHLQLRLDPQTRSPRARPEALGPWVGPRHDPVREPRPPVGPAPPAGRQPKAPEDWWPRAQQLLTDRLAPQAGRGLVALYLWATLLQSAIASGRT
jgi:hypothetical protein